MRDGKGGKERIVPLSRQAESALRRYGLPCSGPVFSNMETGEPLTPASVSRMIAEQFRSVDSDATAHQCRHLFATMTYQKSLDLRLVQELLGHSDPSTTAIYAAFADSRAVEVVRDLSLG